MIINTTGKITDELYVLGTCEVPAFLLAVDRPVIIDAGFAAMGGSYLKMIKNILRDKAPQYCLLTHSHYDHCGAVSQFQTAFPSMQTLCSPQAAAVFKRPNAIKMIKALNQAIEEQTDFKKGLFQEFKINQSIEDNQIIRLTPALTIEVIQTPGHTRDSLSYYIPELKMLFTGEAVGIMDESGYIFSEWLSDYDHYLTSMHKLNQLEIKTLCLGHNYVLTGPDAAGFIAKSLEYCRSFRMLIETCLSQEKGSLQQVLQRIKSIEYDSKIGLKQPEPAYLLNLEAKIKNILRKGTT